MLVDSASSLHVLNPVVLPLVHVVHTLSAQQFI